MPRCEYMDMVGNGVGDCELQKRRWRVRHGATIDSTRFDVRENGDGGDGGKKSLEAV